MKKFFTLSIILLAAINGIAQIAGYNTSLLTGGNNNFGASPLAPSTSNINATVGGLTRASGVSTTGGSGANRALGGNNFQFVDAAAAIAANSFFTTTLSPNTGYTMSLSSIDPFSYRRSGTGATNALIQYQLGSGAFVDITTVAFPNTGNGGATLSSIDLSGIPALQAIPSGTIVTFRIVPFGGTALTGTFYFFDVAVSTASDFSINGTVDPVIVSISNNQTLFAAKNNKSAMLNFTLGCTLATLTYEIERSTNSFNYTVLKTETVTQSRCEQPFYFEDAQPINAVNYYRIKATNPDGRYFYSNIATVKFGTNETIKVVPSITQSSATIFYEAANTTKSTWAVYDINGKLILSKYVVLTKGQNSIAIDLSTFSSGKYFVKGSTEKGLTETLQIIKQ
jgi:hypothetical protein